MEDTTSCVVYPGLDVGKTTHHGCVLAADGTTVYDPALPPDEERFRGAHSPSQKSPARCRTSCGQSTATLKFFRTQDRCRN